jgi:hypothetical protein
MPSLQTGEVHISAVPGAIRGEGAAPTIIDLDFEQDVLSETKRIDREMMPPDGGYAALYPSCKLRAYTCCVVRNMLKFIRD